MSTWAVEHRPRRFAEVAGQSQIAPVLQAMVARYHREGRFPQALILFGPRGTGKTTVARILSKSLNCTNPQEGEPCDECRSCLAVAEGRSAGVQEMDMASNGSVADIRNLKQGAAFALVEDWRVFLMDEVHSASREAFDALLKIVEEPPPKTLFLLVTTEPTQIPETIRSRCLDFEFRRIPHGVIVQRLAAVADEHGLTPRLEPGVLDLLATRSRGGMRDAIMSLEQLSYHDGPLNIALVKETFGISDLPQRLLDAALKADLTRGLAQLNDALNSAVPAAALLDALLDALSALLSAACGLPPSSGSALDPDWLKLYAPTPTRQVLAAMRTLFDARARISGAASSAPAILAVAYSLVVRDLAPAAFARASSPAPVSGPSAPSALPVQARRTLPADALNAIFSRTEPISAEELEKLTGTSANGSDPP